MLQPTHRLSRWQPTLRLLSQAFCFLLNNVCTQKHTETEHRELVCLALYPLLKWKFVLVPPVYIIINPIEIIHTNKTSYPLYIGMFPSWRLCVACGNNNALKKRQRCHSHCLTHSFFLIRRLRDLVLICYCDVHKAEQSKITAGMCGDEEVLFLSAECIYSSGRLHDSVTLL